MSLDNERKQLNFMAVACELRKQGEGQSQQVPICLPYHMTRDKTNIVFKFSIDCHRMIQWTIFSVVLFNQSAIIFVVLGLYCWLLNLTKAFCL